MMKLIARYAIEASESVRWAKKLVEFHNFEDKIKIINKKIEDIKESEIEPVDVLISEPLGVLLVNERMIETFLIARDKYYEN